LALNRHQYAEDNAQLALSRRLSFKEFRTKILNQWSKLPKYKGCGRLLRETQCPNKDWTKNNLLQRYCKFDPRYTHCKQKLKQITNIQRQCTFVLGTNNLKKFKVIGSLL